jgi:multiple sugar transport system substrate-binding protein
MNLARLPLTLGLALAVTGVLPAAAQTTINFVGTETPETFEPVITAFHAANPDIRIEYQQIPFASFNAQIEARVGSQDPTIDVYQADTPRVPTLASRGYLLDLSAYAEQIEAIATPTEQTAVSFDGTFYAFPLWTGTQLLYYNRALLDAAGLPHPDDDPTGRLSWESVLDMAAKAQEAGTEFGFTFHQVDRYFQLQPLFESRDAGSGLTGDALLDPAITGPDWIEVAIWYQNLFESGLSPRGVAPEQMPDMFINGQVAMIYGGLPLVRRFGNAEGLDFGVAPVPVFEGARPVTSTGSWALGVSPYSPNVEAALAFASFMTLDTDGAIASMSGTSAVPVNQNAYPSYLEKLAVWSEGRGDAGAILTYEIQNTAVPRPRSAGYVVFEEIMNAAFGDIRNGAAVEETLRAAEERLRSALSRL